MNAFVLIAPFHHLEVVEVGENFQEIDKGKTGVYIRIIYIVYYIIYTSERYTRSFTIAHLPCRTEFRKSNVNLLHFSIDQETTVKNLKVTLNMQHEIESSFLTAGVKVASSIASYALELTTAEG